MTPYFAHASACIDPEAQIGAETRIWHFCHVSAGARIGARCSLGQNVYVAPRVSIGDGVKIQNNVSVYEGVHVEDEVFLGPSMVFTNVRTPRAGVARNSAEHYATTRVKRGASIGANATVVCGVTIHAYALVAAGAVVTRDVPAHAVVAGVPARRIGWACTCGPLLCFEGELGRCPECARRYRLTGEELRPAEIEVV